jgi:hypothetical protein
MSMEFSFAETLDVGNLLSSGQLQKVAALHLLLIDI